MEKDFLELIEIFYRISGKINRMRSVPLSLDGIEPLNAGAIHLIEMIGKHEDYNLTQIAEALGITKGAVSQMTTKLEKKQLLAKGKQASNDKDVFFTLTDQGRRIYDGHEKLHRDLYEKLSEIFYKFESYEIEKIKDAFKEIEQCVLAYGHL